MVTQWVSEPGSLESPSLAQDLAAVELSHGPLVDSTKPISRVVLLSSDTLGGRMVQSQADSISLRGGQ